jgi:hypothetical protein
MATISNFKKKIFLVILMMPVCNAFCQTVDDVSLSFTIPELSLIDIEPSAQTSLTFNLTANTEAGLPISATGATNNSLWLNYSSSIPTGRPNKKVTVQVSSGTIPSGISISLLASAYSGTGGAGTFGTPTGTIALSTTAQTLISGIGRCYTGNGQSNGHQLTYTIGISDYKSLYYIQSAILLIAFTITDM